MTGRPCDAKYCAQGSAPCEGMELAAEVFQLSMASPAMIGDLRSSFLGGKGLASAGEALNMRTPLGMSSVVAISHALAPT